MWKDNWLLIGGKGFVTVYSITEKKIIHNWKTAVEGERGAIEVVKIFLLPDFTFVCGCTKGWVQIHGFSAPRLGILQIEPAGDINDMIISDNDGKGNIEYALATEVGLMFIRVIA